MVLAQGCSNRPTEQNGEPSNKPWIYGNLTYDLEEILQITRERKSYSLSEYLDIHTEKNEIGSILERFLHLLWRQYTVLVFPLLCRLWLISLLCCSLFHSLTSLLECPRAQRRTSALFCVPLCTPLVISSRLRALNTISLLMTTKYVSPAQTSPSSSSFAHATPYLTPLDVLHPKFNTAKTELLIAPLPQISAPPHLSQWQPRPSSFSGHKSWSHFRTFYHLTPHI